MKKNLFLLAIATFVMTSCTKINQGWFGVKAYNYGDQKGQAEHLDPGIHALSWFGQYSISEYPSTVQQHSWTGDNCLKFQAEGQVLKADVGIDYGFSPDPTARVRMFQKYRREPDEIVEGFIRKDIVSSLNKVVQNMSVEDVYSRCKDSIRQAVEDEVSKKYEKDGIIINNITFLSNIVLPDKVQKAIDEKVEAKQKALQRENEIAQVEAEARKKVAEARGIAESAEIEAKGRAKAIEIEGKALRENPQIMELKRVEAQKVAAESSSHWQNPVFSAQQSSLFLGLGSGK